jgi:hypothetical protein
MSEVLVETTAGKVRGTIERGILTFEVSPTAARWAVNAVSSHRCQPSHGQGCVIRVTSGHSALKWETTILPKHGWVVKIISTPGITILGDPGNTAFADEQGLERPAIQHHFNHDSKTMPHNGELTTSFGYNTDSRWWIPNSLSHSNSLSGECLNVNCYFFHERMHGGN